MLEIVWKIKIINFGALTNKGVSRGSYHILLIIMNILIVNKLTNYPLPYARVDNYRAVQHKGERNKLSV